MSDGIEIDTSGFDAYAGDLRVAVAEVTSELPKVVGRGALNVKKEWNDAFAESDSFKGVAGTVSYDTRSTTQFVEAVVGPDASNRKAANLANIAHFGGANGGGGTVADPQTFLDNEEPRLLSALDAMIGKALR